MKYRTRMQSVLEDREVYAELLEAGFLRPADPDTESLPGAAEAPPPVEELRAATTRMARGEFDPDNPTTAEAIILRFGAPSLLVRGGTYLAPKLAVWRQRLDPHRTAIDRAIAGVGRIELTGHPLFKWVGTGWMLDETVVVTNRHVARIFADQSGGTVFIRQGIGVVIDYREEHLGTDAGVFETEIGEIVHIEPPQGVDLALLRLKRSAVAAANVTPLSIETRLEDVPFVGVIGYPAFDPRNSPEDQSRIFDDIYDVKRFAPGKVIGEDRTASIFLHDCTTLGGNSGSCVIDIASGAAVGLHFGGREGESNRAVRPEAILERARRAQVAVRLVEEVAAPGEAEPPRPATGDYAGRSGYDPRFLGADTALAVPLPRLNALQQRDAVTLADGGIELRYEHFSIVMNGPRRLAFFAAVNIDGTDLWHKPRKSDSWTLDPRIPEEAQVDNALYTNNDFDRGHLVRRLDPVWGAKAAAARAERDTFHWTNAAPQHKDLNRKIWLQLEDHLLARTDEADARVSVFVGPIFGYADPRSRRDRLEEVGIPLGFWKVIASIGRTRRRKPKLEAQAFVIWQRDMIADRDLELIFGAGLETYQVSVAALERLTGLEFRVLREADTFEREEPAAGIEAVAAATPAAAFRERALPIRTPRDIL